MTDAELNAAIEAEVIAQDPAAREDYGGKDFCRDLSSTLDLARFRFGYRGVAVDFDWRDGGEWEVTIAGASCKAMSLERSAAAALLFAARADVG